MMNRRTRASRVVWASWILALGLAGTAWGQATGSKQEVAPGAELTELGTYDLARLRQIVTTDLTAFLEGSPYPVQPLLDKLKDAPRHPVKLFKVHYRTTVPEAGDSPQEATGLLAIPDTAAGSLPLISYQHGTVFERSSVPSSPANSYETQVMLAVFAAQGYAVIAADYVGLGDSRADNTFFVPGATVQACVDLLQASRAALTARGKRVEHLFLHGWSQGGYNTLQFLRRLEAMGETVTAASTAAAPTDLRVWINRLMNNPQPGDAPWLVSAASNLILATDAYELPGLAAQAIRPAYLDLARKFYRFEIGFPAFFAGTPPALKEYLNPEFMASGRLGGTPFWQALERKENYRWAVSTPLRTYYGEVDEAVPAEIAQWPARVARLFGTRTQAVSAGPQADHRATYLFSLTEIPAWHRTLTGR